MPKRLAVVLANVTVIAALMGGTTAFAAFHKSVELTVEGETQRVLTFAPTVKDVLESRDVEVDPEDKMSHHETEPLADGEEIVVNYAKPIVLTVDGKETEKVVYDVTVGDLLDRLDVDVEAGAYVSHELDASIDRDGEAITVSNPKDVVVVADGEKRKITTVAPTAGEVLADLDIALGDDDEVEPAVGETLSNDDTVRVVRIEKVKRTEKVKTDFETEIEEDSSAFKGDVDVVQEGKKGVETREVLVTLADGKERDKKVLSSKVVRKPTARIEKRGTKTKTFSRVWDRLAQCESGGNWKINTGNGFYGGLQFTADTWRRVGGSGLPHENSREEQIKRGMILQERAGWGQWPSCTRKLGLR